MDASVLYKGPDDAPVIFMTQVAEPPPERHTFTDPDTGVSVEADLAGVTEGVAIYRQVGMPNP
jgi:hypothetical protein